jgi:hypothetical protein
LALLPKWFSGAGAHSAFDIPAIERSSTHSALIVHRAYGFAVDYLIDAETSALIERYRRCGDSGLAGSLRLLIEASGAVTQEDNFDSRTLADCFRRSGHVVIPCLFTPLEVACLRKYYRELIKSGFVPLGDRQVSHRYHMHSEAAATQLHRRLTPFIGALVGRTVKPSYCFMASYVTGAELTQHTDREQCEYTVSVLIDFEPEPEALNPWPLILTDDMNNDIPLRLRLGDGALYRGRVLAHRRPIFEQEFSTSIFFHYVDDHFSGDLD